MLVSQFTLLGDCRKGRRPSFFDAMGPETANAMFETCCMELKKLGLNIKTGVFGADMQVSLINDGPVTILLDSRRKF